MVVNIEELLDFAEIFCLPMKKSGLVSKDQTTQTAHVMHVMQKGVSIAKHVERITLGWMARNHNIGIGWMENQA